MSSGNLRAFDPRLATASVIGLAVLLGGLAIWSAGVRPVYYDEFYSFLQGQPRWSFGSAFSEHWLRDNHPPTYYALLHMAQRVTSEIAQLRLLNLAGMALAGLATLAILRDCPRLKPAALLFFIALCCSYRFVADVTNLRSYSLQASADFTVLVGIAAVLMQAPLGKWAKASLGIAIIAGLNLHVTNSITLTIFLAGSGTICLVRRDIRGAMTILLPATAGIAIMLGFVTFQLPHWQDNLSAIDPIAPGEMLDSLGKATRIILLPNVFLLLLALTKFIRRSAPARILGGEKSAEARIIVLLLASAVAAIAFLAILAPIALYSRHLVLVQAQLLFAIALLAAIALGTWDRRLANLALGFFALLAVVQLVRHTIAVLEPLETQWGGPDFLTASEEQCSGQFRVHVAEFPASFYDPISGPDASAVTAEYLRFHARNLGMDVEPPESRQLSQDCPTAIWILDTLDPDWSEERRAATVLAELRQQGFQVSTIDFHRPRNDHIALVE